MRESEKESEGRGKSKEISIFIRNLPDKLDQFSLRGIFQKIGRVWDAYSPRRNAWSSQGRFGFARFRTIKETKDSI